MRTYGRVFSDPEHYTWEVVETDANGFNDYVYVTALIQELKLNLNESPFWGNRGIPAKPSVVTQVAPDYYTMLMQQRYAPHFLTIAISRQPDHIVRAGIFQPVYDIRITTHYGVQINTSIAV